MAKAGFLTRPRPSSDLLETLRLEDRGYFLMQRHLRRLKESAEYFPFLWKERNVLPSLELVSKTHPRGVWRVRLLLSRDGQLRTEAAEMSSQSGKVWKLGLAPGPLDSQSPWVYHKTAHRVFYEQPLRDRQDCDDLIFFNESGEITESSIANIVGLLGGQKVTPPRSSGILAGTFRGELLACGEILEQRLSKQDIVLAKEIYLINSVQKWMPA